MPSVLLGVRYVPFCSRRSMQLRNYLVQTSWLNSTTQVLTTEPDGISIMRGNVITILTNIGSPVRIVQSPSINIDILTTGIASRRISASRHTRLGTIVSLPQSKPSIYTLTQILNNSAPSAFSRAPNGPLVAMERWKLSIPRAVFPSSWYQMRS